MHHPVSVYLLNLECMAFHRVGISAVTVNPGVNLNYPEAAGLISGLCCRRSS